MYDVAHEIQVAWNNSGLLSDWANMLGYAKTRSSKRDPGKDELVLKDEDWVPCHFHCK